jgi:predicted ester cyclase
MIAEEDRVVARALYSGTHRGELFGVAPTGEKIAYAGAAFFRIADGRVAEGWVLGDLLSVLRQIGANAMP